MLRHLIQLISGSALGKMLGLVREVLFASLLGTSTWADAYRAAFSATISFSHLLTSEALNAAFVPQFARDREQRAAAAWTLFNGLSLLLLFTSTAAAVLLYLLAPQLAAWIYPGFEVETAAQTIAMLRIMALGVVPYVLCALWIALEMAHERFRYAALRPLVQNVGVIGALGLAWWQGSPLLVAWGFTGTYVVFLTVGALSLARRMARTPAWHRGMAQFKDVGGRFWRAMRPMLVFSVLMQGNLLLEKAVGSLIGTGAVAAVDYARLLPETAHVLLVVPLGLVSLSTLARMDDAEARQRIDLMLAAAALLLVPCSAFLLIAAEPTVHAIYARGAFDAASVQLTAAALRGMAIGLWMTGLANVMLKVLNARLRNSAVLRIGMLGVLANVVVNLLLYRSLGVLALGLGNAANGAVMLLASLRTLGGLRGVHKTLLVLFGLAMPYVLVGMWLTPLLVDSVWAALGAQLGLTVLYWPATLLAVPHTRELARTLRARLQSSREASA